MLKILFQHQEKGQRWKSGRGCGPQSQLQNSSQQLQQSRRRCSHSTSASLAQIQQWWRNGRAPFQLPRGPRGAYLVSHRKIQLPGTAARRTKSRQRCPDPDIREIRRRLVEGTVREQGRMVPLELHPGKH